MHHPASLLGNCLDEAFMAVTKRRDGNARPEIQESSSVSRVQASALTMLESKVDSFECWHQSGNHGDERARLKWMGKSNGESPAPENSGQGTGCCIPMMGVLPPIRQIQSWQRR
ncbi:hypothetical protein AA105894_0493 [Asaia spathodeae NBRC 105894]|nr:hypothetical protein AA105894_0493 [Asaia spathodeae NBRC 105894]